MQKCLRQSENKMHQSQSNFRLMFILVNINIFHYASYFHFIEHRNFLVDCQLMTRFLLIYKLYYHWKNWYNLNYHGKKSKFGAYHMVSNVVFLRIFDIEITTCIKHQTCCALLKLFRILLDA